MAFESELKTLSGSAATQTNKQTIGTEVKTLSWNRGEVSSKVTRESNTKSDKVDLYILKIYFQQCKIV